MREIPEGMALRETRTRSGFTSPVSAIKRKRGRPPKCRAPMEDKENIDPQLNSSLLDIRNLDIEMSTLAPLKQLKKCMYADSSYGFNKTTSLLKLNPESDQELSADENINKFLYEKPVSISTAKPLDRLECEESLKTEPLLYD